MKSTAIAHPNIAFVKYWGNHDPGLRLPLNDSISMNLEALSVTTSVEFDPSLERDEVQIDGKEADEAATRRVSQHLDRVRTLAKVSHKARVLSQGNFPQASGLASSAAAFAALSVAAAHAAGLELKEREMSVLARQGSGSAARSVPAGFVEWIASRSSAESYARSIAEPEHWALRDVIAVVSDQPKTVSSTEGHLRSLTSPFIGERLSRLPSRFHRVRHAIRACDLVTLGAEIETEAYELHTIAMTSRPAILYWSPGTVRVMHAVYAWRAEGLPVYFTMDAGANVHLICGADHADEIARCTRELADVKDVLVSGPGGAAKLVENT